MKLEKPMLKHHPVVKVENYNVHNDHTASWIYDLYGLQHITRKEKINSL